MLFVFFQIPTTRSSSRSDPARPGFCVQKDPSCFRIAINKGYKAAGFGSRRAGGTDAERQQWMPGGILRKIDFNYTRNDFGTAKIDLV
jgi:hypothetical protein